MDHFASAVQRTIRDEQLWEPGARVVVGLSGGPDSTALLFALIKFTPPGQLIVAHLNHGLRGEESDRDEDWVRDVAEGLHLEIAVNKLTAPPASNLEEKLRELRYDFLARTAKTHGAACVAVGHQADDVAETLLLNLTRGAGSAGLSSLRSRSVLMTSHGRLTVTRPLIRQSRAEVLAYLERNGKKCREDSTNLDLRHPRNRVRHQIMPLLAKINPAASEALARAALILGREADLMEELALEFLADQGGQGEVNLRALRGRPRGLRLAVYRAALRLERGDLRRLAEVHLEAMDRLVMSQSRHGSLDLPGFKVRQEYDRLWFEFAPAAATPGEVELAVPGEVTWPGPDGSIRVVRIEEVKEAGAPDHESVTVIDGSALRPPLVVRTRRPGEKFQPAGMDGHRRLKKALNELKVPPSWRDHWPILADREGIVWVPGLRPADRAHPGPDAKLLRVTITSPLLQNED